MVILPGELEPLDPAARPVRRLRYGSKPAAGLIVHENGDGFVDDETVDFLPVQPGGEQPLISEIMLETKVELIGAERIRSEEHTSELQSLMRISYAVFCLKK